jgi:hypothetical protein
MYFFVLDFAIEMPYPLAPPQGWEGSLVFENLAVSHQHSAFSQSNPNLNHKGHEGTQRGAPVAR